MSKHYSAGDYAGLEGGGFSFYYGYEETKVEEWAFVAKKHGIEFLRLSTKELGIRDGDEPIYGLLSGIAKSLDVLHLD